MSLVNFALRTCLKRALTGRTLAEGRVYDSMIVPLPELVGQDAQPQIVVSTEDADTQLTSFDLLTQETGLDLVIEIVVAAAVEIEGGSVSLEVPHTDAGMEAVLDFVQRGVLRAIVDPDNAWAQLFLDLAGRPARMHKRRGADTKGGLRFAARQIVLSLTDTAAEPAYGMAPPPGSGFDRFLAALRADAEMADYADAVLKLIIGEALPSWRVLQASLGLTVPSLRALGIGPYDPTEAGEPPVLASVITDEKRADGSTSATFTTTAD